MITREVLFPGKHYADQWPTIIKKLGYPGDAYVNTLPRYKQIPVKEYEDCTATFCTNSLHIGTFFKSRKKFNRKTWVLFVSFLFPLVKTLKYFFIKYKFSSTRSRLNFKNALY